MSGALARRRAALLLSKVAPASLNREEIQYASVGSQPFGESVHFSIDVVMMTMREPDAFLDSGPRSRKHPWKDPFVGQRASAACGLFSG
jgi:hypothetical protein